MKVLIVDMTHGGQLIANEFLKIPNYEVFALDIYSSMNSQIRNELQDKGLKFFESLNELKEYKNTGDNSDFIVVAPIHCKLEYPVDMTHHEAVGFLLKHKINIPIIEVTGVKGKTSVVWILKEILKDLSPLILSSLGVEVLEEDKWKVLKRDISITPASIIEAFKLAEEYEIGICIFETSLGGTGLADVGILTNLAENYPIASRTILASDAKLQIFKSKSVVCEINAFNTNYSEFKDKTNTFGNSSNGKGVSNVMASQIRFEFDRTEFNIDIEDFKTPNNDIINKSFQVSTFAPAPYHVDNVLSAVSASLSLEVPMEKIKDGLNNFKGVKGRTSINEKSGIRVIEEINPGLNVIAVKKSLLMIENMDNVGVIFGGKYGVTCEEIDEESVSDVLEDLNENIPLILVDELGHSIGSIIKRNFIYSKDLNGAINCAIDKTCSNILVIYRSNFSDLKKR
ncbi:MAG: coenzyme F430 synthase [Methanobacterium sp.]